MKESLESYVARELHIQILTVAQTLTRIAAIELELKESEAMTAFRRRMLVLTLLYNCTPLRSGFISDIMGYVHNNSSAYAHRRSQILLNTDAEFSREYQKAVKIINQ